MPYAKNGGVGLYCEETGEGTPIVFLHEFLNDHTGWEDQVRHFARGYRCVTYAARGYPPSDAPEAEDAYGQDIFTADALAVLDHLGLGRAHLVGLSMGAYTALQIALAHPDRVLSVVAASGASGGHWPNRETFEAEMAEAAKQLEPLEAMPGTAMVSGPTRIQLKHKDPIAWSRNAATVSRRPVHAAAKTMRGIQLGRAPVYDFEEALRALETPVLLLVGDEDESCLDVNLYLKRVMPSARLAVFPGCGHALNLEEPALFNRFAERFIASVERGAWRPRDPAAMPAEGRVSALGLDSGRD